MVIDVLYAYIDPGVGATVMQLVLAGVVGVGALLKLRWRQIRGFFQRGRVAVEDQPGERADAVD